MAPLWSWEVETSSPSLQSTQIPGKLLSRRWAESRRPSQPDALVLEAWSEGYMIGSLIIMAAITLANMRKGVLLHKLILLELFLGMGEGTFIFTHYPVYGWYLGVTGMFLNLSWSLHNVIAWMKTKPFLTKKWSWFYIGTVILAQPYWGVEIYATFAYFNNISDLFVTTRPYEALFRDPWWVFTVINLFYNIIRQYHLPLLTVIRISPRFGVLLVSMMLSVGFIIVDILSVSGALSSVLPDGLNPFWKLAFVFKCLTDSIILDDFKTALDRLMTFKLRREGINNFIGHDNPATAFSPTDEPWSAADTINRFSFLTDKTVPAVSHLEKIPSRVKRQDPFGEDALEADNEAEKITEEQMAASSSGEPTRTARGGLTKLDTEAARRGSASFQRENMSLREFLAAGPRSSKPYDLNNG